MEPREEKISQLLSRNVENVIEKDHLQKALESGKKLRVKLGIDPTSPDLHIGHAVVLRKLKEFQDLGHQIVLIIGDFTAQIGDPSGRDKTRPPLTAKDVKTNMNGYLDQASKIIDIKKSEVRFNSVWLDKLNGASLVRLLDAVSLQQIIEREDFQKRLSSHHSIRMHELLYPIMQAYDSVSIKADVELGGTDQLFNLLVGRSLMGKFDTQPQDIVTVPLLVGLDGERKMSKSYGNYIGLKDTPEDMFGKTMSLPDALVEKYFAFCTDIPEKEVKALKKELGPKELKERLGLEIVKIYHGEKAAQKAQENFEKLFSKKEIPDDIPELKLKTRQISAIDLIVASDTAKSKSDARRLIEQGGFEFDGETIRNPQDILNIESGKIVRIGKKRFYKVKLQ
jgi:tyrosyl-tRNA synthetase